jgi:hypothetical protein
MLERFLISVKHDNLIYIRYLNIVKKILPSASEPASEIHGPMCTVSIFARHLGLLFETRLAPRAPCWNSVNGVSTGSSPGASLKSTLADFFNAT